MTGLMRLGLFKHFLLLVLFTVVLRMILLWPLGLNDDEAYYWMWSHMPSYSYFDNTPGAGWFLMPFNALLGDSVSTLRLVSGLTAVLTSLAILLAATELMPALTIRQRVIILWLSALSGMVMAMTQVWTPDAPLLLFSALAFWQLFRALETRHTNAWLACGVFFALALLAKANTGLYIAFIGLWMLIHPEARKQLMTPGPWLAFAIILLALMPVLVWNMQNDWAFIQFQFGHVFSPQAGKDNTPQPFTIHWGQIAALMLAYLVFAGPAAVVALQQFAKKYRQANALSVSQNLAYSIALSTTTLFLLIAVYKNFTANWALVSLLLLFIIGIGPLVASLKRSWLWIQAAFVIPVIALLVALNYVPATVAKSPNWRNGLVWDNIYQVMREQQAMQEKPALLAAIKYQDAAQLAFREHERWSALPGGHAVPALNLAGRSNHFAYVWRDDSYRGADMVVLYDQGEENLIDHFCAITKLGEFEAKYLGKTLRKFSLYLGEGFLGRPDVDPQFDRSLCEKRDQAA